MQLLQKIEKNVKNEMKAVCNDPTFVGRSIGSLKTVTFDSLYAILEKNAPIIMGILRACIPPTSVKIQSVSLMCIATLIKTHQSFTLVHMYISLILYAGHAGKQVI